MQVVWRVAMIGICAAALLLTAILLVFPEIARAQIAVRCDSHSQIVALLEKRFGEKRQAFGVIGEAAIMEIFASEHGTWSIVVTGTNGRSCITAAGDGWEGGLDVAGKGI